MSFKLDKAYLKKFRCLYRWCPPLPIPNREVKPTRADGTAVTRGRVGRCQILKETLQQKCSRVFFVYNVSCFFPTGSYISTIKELRSLRYCPEHAFLNGLNPLMVSRGCIILFLLLRCWKNLRFGYPARLDSPDGSVNPFWVKMYCFMRMVSQKDCSAQQDRTRPIGHSHCAPKIR
jgi:hypothetical protein